MTLREILEYQVYGVGDFSLTVGKLLAALLIILGARWLINLTFRFLLNRVFRRRKVDIGRQFAIKAFLKYILYTLAILWALQVIGVQFSVILGGAAALLVGVGLGLQQTFNDLISGVILLSESTVEVGDIVIVDGIIGTVTNIGIRTSTVESRDNISIIVPNSKLVGDNVTNWSHNQAATRFKVTVGVSYDSDVKLVTALLLESVKDHDDILQRPAPSVQFVNFGNSSLDFDLFFYSNEFLRSDIIKSDVRFHIIELFRKHGVEIPFPQRDVWLRTSTSIQAKESDQSD